MYKTISLIKVSQSQMEDERLINFNSTYKDLVIEIDILEIRIDDLAREREYLIHAMYHNAPKFNGVVDYSKDNVQNGFVPMSLDRILERLEDINNAIDFQQEMLNKKKDTLRKIEHLLDKLEGLDYEVAYMRDMQGMSLQQIADKLGYSYNWVSKISSKIKKAKRRQENLDKPC